MKRIPLFGYLMIVMYVGIFVLSLYFFNIGRLKTSENYYRESQNSSEKEVLLLKSTLLSPSKPKILELTDIYYKKNQPKMAEFWLKRIKGTEGKLILAQHYLCTGELAKFESIVAKIPEKNELNTIKAILEEPRNIDNINKTETELGALLNSIAVRNYDVRGKTYFNVLLQQSKKETKINTEFSFAKKLIIAGHNKLARYILERLITENQDVAVFYEQVAESYNNEGQFDQALTNMKRAILTDPSRINYYNKAIEYAKKSGNQSEINYLEESQKRILGIRD